MLSDGNDQRRQQKHIGAAHMTTTIDAPAGATDRPNGPPSPDHLDLLEAESTSALGPNEIGVVRLAVGTPRPSIPIEPTA
jgi:hypothetical protein